LQATLNKDAFFEDLGYRPHPGQREVHACALPRRVVACGVRWGKTLSSAMEGLAAAMEPRTDSIGWVVAPTYDLADRVFRQIVSTAMEHIQHRVVSVREHDRRILIRNLGGGISEIRGKSADNPVSLLGEGLDWLIVDEAARLKPSIWEAHLSQRLLDRKGWALLISTPRGKGWYYDLWRRGQGQDPLYKSWNQPSWTNPRLDQESIEAERGRLPERVFKQEYGAEFLEGSGQVFRNVRDCATGGWEEPKPGATYYAGLDLAKVEDYTVLTVLDAAGNVVAVDRFHRLDWGLQITRVESTARRFQRARMTVDTTGVGEPIYEALRKAGCRVEPYTFTQKSKDALINHLAMMLENKAIRLPSPGLWPEGIDELEAFEYSVTDRGTMRTGAPSGMHDDCVISLALAAWNLRRIKRQIGII
jgi:hypothetical protein